VETVETAFNVLNSLLGTFIDTYDNESSINNIQEIMTSILDVSLKYANGRAPNTESFSYANS